MSTAPGRARHKKSHFLALCFCSNLLDDCEMSWPERRGQTTQGRPSVDWRSLLFAALPNSCCLCRQHPSDVLPASDLRLILVPGSSGCCWINEVPTITILLTPPLGEISGSIVDERERSTCCPCHSAQGRWEEEAENEGVVLPSSSCSQFLPKPAC